MINKLLIDERVRSRRIISFRCGEIVGTKSGRWVRCAEFISYCSVYSIVAVVLAQIRRHIKSNQIKSNHNISNQFKSNQIKSIQFKIQFITYQITSIQFNSIQFNSYHIISNQINL